MTTESGEYLLCWFLDEKIKGRARLSRGYSGRRGPLSQDAGMKVRKIKEREGVSSLLGRVL